MKIKQYGLIVALLCTAVAGQCAPVPDEKAPAAPQGTPDKKKMELAPLPDEGADYQMDTPESDEPYDEIGDGTQDPEDREDPEETLAPDVKAPAKAPLQAPVKTPAKK
jgi:hypothetical protein